MNTPFIGSKVKQLRQKFSQSVGLPVQDALPASQIEAVLEAEHVVYRRCLFDPIVTTWAFLSQVLDADRSCRKAISRVFAYLSDTQPQVTDPMELIDSEADTGAYCKARQRLSLNMLKRLYRRVATHLEDAATPERRWLGRRVFLADGTTVLTCLPPGRCRIRQRIKQPILNTRTRKQAVVFLWPNWLRSSP